MARYVMEDDAPQAGRFVMEDGPSGYSLKDHLSKTANVIKRELSDIGFMEGNLVAGGLRGAGSIGATLLYPYDKAKDIINGDRAAGVTSLVTGKKPLSRNQERRQMIDEGLRSAGATPESIP